MCVIRRHEGREVRSRVVYSEHRVKTTGGSTVRVQRKAAEDSGARVSLECWLGGAEYVFPLLARGAPLRAIRSGMSRVSAISFSMVRSNTPSFADCASPNEIASFSVTCQARHAEIHAETGRGRPIRPLGCTLAVSQLSLSCLLTVSRLSLGCLSAVSQLSLDCLSAVSRLSLVTLGCLLAVSAVSRCLSARALPLGCLSAVSRLPLGYLSTCRVASMMMSL